MAKGNGKPANGNKKVSVHLTVKEKVWFKTALMVESILFIGVIGGLVAVGVMGTESVTATTSGAPYPMEGWDATKWPVSNFPTIGQLAQNGSLELLYKGKPYDIRRGTVLDGWQNRTAASGVYDEYVPAPRLIDLDNDGLQEVVAQHTDSSGKYLIQVFESDGTDMPGWPKQVGYWYSNVAAGDINNDGQDELIFVSKSIGESLTVRDGAFMAYKLDGSPVPGWPNIRMKINELIAGDINGDHNVEIIAADDTTVRAYSNTGTLLWQAGNSTYNDANFALADVNRDGKSDVIVTTTYYSQPLTHKLFAFSGSNGSTLPGYPITFTVKQGGDLFMGHEITPAAVADLNHDGTPELVKASYDGQLHVWNATSPSTELSGWPKDIGVEGNSTPSIADIDSDGQLEIIVNTNLGLIHAYHLDGSEATGWPISLSQQGIGSVIVADVNLDGKLEAIFDASGWTRIYTIPNSTATTWIPTASTICDRPSPNISTKPMMEMNLRSADQIRGVQPIMVYASKGACGTPSSIQILRDAGTSPVATSTNSEVLKYDFDTAGANGVVSWSAKAPGAAGSEGTVSVNDVIMDNTAPTINAFKLVWKYSYPAFQEDTRSILIGDRQLEVIAEDSNGIADVKFYLDGVYKATVTTAPYRYAPPIDLAEGNHDFMAVVRDAAGNETTSATKTLYVDRSGPTITVLSPQPNAVLSGTTVKISANAVDAKSGVAGMLFYKLTPPCVPDNPNIPCPFGMPPEGLTSTYSTNETSHLDSFKIPNGSATLQITAADGSGNKTIINVPVTINNPDDKTPPRVTVSVEQCNVDAVSPALIEYCNRNGSLLTGLRRATATVNDANRVTDVSFYLVAGAVETSIKTYLNQGYFATPFGSYVDFLTGTVKSDGSYMYADGTYTLKARSTDRAGNVGEATWPTPIVIQNGATPTVTLNIPNGAMITTGTVLEASIDQGKTATAVKFALDDGEETLASLSAGTQNLPSSAPPYRFTYPGSQVPDGVYKLSAYVYTDVAHNVAYSSPPVTVTIDNTTHDPLYPPGHRAARAHGSSLGFNGSNKSIYAGYDLSINGTTQITAQAWGENGIEWVEYYVDAGGQPLARLNQPPYEYNWDTTTVTNGEHYVHIRYKDRKGNVWDDNVRQYVLNGSRSYMRLIAPTTKTVVSGKIPFVCEIVPGNIPLSYDRSICDGVNNDIVNIYAAGHTVAEWLTEPDPAKRPGDVEYLPDGRIRLSLRDGFDTTKLPDGIYYLSLFYVDIGGMRYLSEPAVLNIENTRPHGAAFTAPIGGATVSGDNVLFKVNDIQMFGTAKTIEWYRDGKLIAKKDNVIYDAVRMNEYAYEYYWNSTGVPNGTHVMMVKTYSADGQVNTSEISVNVQNPEASIGMPLVARLYQPTGTTVGMCMLEITQGVETLEYAKWYRDGQFEGLYYYRSPVSYGVNYDAIFASQQTLPGLHKYKVELSNRVGVVTTSECSLTTPTPLESYIPTVTFQKPAADSIFTNTRSIYFQKHQMSLYAPEADTHTDLSVDGRVVWSTDKWPTGTQYYVWDTKPATDGTHQMLLKIADAGGRSNSATIAYTTKNNPQVEFSAPANNATVTGNIELTATATSGYATERVKFYRGDTLLGDDNLYPFAVTWNTASVANGSYTIKAVSTDRNNKEATATIQVTVSNDVIIPPAAPTVSITSPASGETFDRTVNITATTTGDQIERVEFYDGTALIGTDTSTPYIFSWNTADVANGSRTLTAKVFGLGGTSTSSAVTITINHLPLPDTTLPTLRITAPAANAQVKGTITISAEASDASGIREVQFYRASDTLLGIDRDAPYSIQWDTTTVVNNDKLIQVTAVDNAGNSKRADVTVYVNNTVEEPIPPKPTVSLLINHNVPVGAASLSGPVPLGAALSATTGVEYVKFVLDANNFNTDTIAPYEVTMDTVRFTNGAHTLKAVAYGRFGNAESQVVNVTITNNIAPTTTVFTVKLPTRGIMTGTRTVTVKPVTKLPVRVECFLNGTLVATDTVAPYYCKWNSRVVQNGSYTWKTVVTNTQGLQTAKESPVTAKNSLRVYWRSPISKAIVKGTVTLNPLILGGNGVSKMEYILDKGTSKVKTLSTLTAGPYTYSWDTSGVTVGRHRLTVRGTDSLTGRTSSQTITVTVTR